jgi:hypothetical protein
MLLAILDIIEIIYRVVPAQAGTTFMRFHFTNCRRICHRPS